MSRNNSDLTQKLNQKRKCMQSTVNRIFLVRFNSFSNTVPDNICLQKNQEFRKSSRNRHVLVITCKPFSDLTVTSTLKTATQLFHTTLCPVLTHHQTKLSYKKLSGSEDIFWTKQDAWTGRWTDRWTLFQYAPPTPTHTQPCCRWGGTPPTPMICTACKQNNANQHREHLQ